MREVDTKILDEITARLVAELQPEKVILFGSRAWGAPTPGSDFDLMVIVSQSDEPPHQRAMRAIRCLRGLGVPKDVLVRTRREFDRFAGVAASLERTIAAHGKVLYG